MKSSRKIWSIPIAVLALALMLAGALAVTGIVQAEYESVTFTDPAGNEVGLRAQSSLTPNPPKSRGISAGAWVKDAARWRCGYDADAGAF